MPIKQQTTYYNDFKIKTYSEFLNDKEIAYIEYDIKGNITLVKHHDGENDDWSKREYDDKGRVTFYENSHGAWFKWIYDEDGNIIYDEDSNGVIVDKRK